MKRLIGFLILAVLLSAAPAFAQGAIAISLRNGTATPAQCQPSSLNVFFNRATGALSVCTAANTWTPTLMGAPGGTVTWVNSLAGDWNPTSNNAYSIGNGLVNPKDIGLTRYLTFYNGATLTTQGRFTLGSTGDLTVAQTTLTSSAPSAALAGAGAGNVDNGSHVYAETCVTAGGETNISASSGAVTVADKTVNGKVTVTLATATPCGAFTTGRNLYRSKAGTTTPLYLVAASPVVADNTTATYTDNIADASLQATTAPANNSAMDTRLTFANAGQLGILGTPNIDMGAGWFSGTTIYGNGGLGNTLTLLDSQAAGAGVGPMLSLGGHTGAGYEELGSIYATKVVAGAGDNQSVFGITYHPTNGTNGGFVFDANGISTSGNDNTYDLGTAAKQFRTGYFGTSVIVGATGTTIVPSGISKYNNISTAGSGVGPIYGSVALTTQAASIGTANAYASAPAGMYRVCWDQQITRAATSTSSLLTTIGWNNGSAKTTTLASLNGGALQTTADASNTLNSEMGNCMAIYSAASQNITYATTYASSGATTMQYRLNVTVEKLN